MLDPNIAEDFQKWSTVYPQPIASSLARLLSSRTPQDTVDSCFKAAEVSTRYIAACCLASFASRNNAGTDGESIQQLEGNISFGTYEQIISQVAGKNIEHPLKLSLEVYNRPQPSTSGSREPESAAIWLSKLVELRNDRGHDLLPISEALARTFLSEYILPKLLHSVLKSFDHFLSFPLFVIENQKIENHVITAQVLLFMGESKEPLPQEIQLATDIISIGHPYFAIDNRILDLHPIIIWEAVPNRAYFGLLIIDGVYDAEINYQSLESEEKEFNGNSVTRLNAITSGQSYTCEEVNLSDGQHLAHIWWSERGRRIDAFSILRGKMPWEKFSSDNMKWYATRLAPGSIKTPRAIIQKELFDGNETFDPDQIFQAILFFGKEAEIKKIIGRNLIDIRIIGDSTARWEKRIESRKNIIQSLRHAIDTLSRTLKIENASLDTFAETNGTPDYIATREALINQFIHQDYHDPRASAQVIISKENISFFNMGYALISTDSLIQGRKSSSRNPLIARALRLIGFAELAGSGLFELQRVWRTANQRPPVFISNKDENNFSLTLDWRPVKDMYNEFWKTKIGVTLTEKQALILNLTADSSGITLDQGVSGSGLSYEATETIFRYLLTQALIEQRDGRYFIRAHLQALVGDAL
jgi:hypothetical protein